MSSEDTLPSGWIVGELAIGKGVFPVMAWRVLHQVEMHGCAVFERGERTEMELREVTSFLLQICERHELRFLCDSGLFMQPATMNNLMSARSWIVINPKAGVAWPTKDKDNGKQQGHSEVRARADTRDSESSNGVPRK